MWCRRATQPDAARRRVLQVVLGIWTLLWQVPLWLGLAHQGGALIVLAAALWNLHTRARKEARAACNQDGRALARPVMFSAYEIA